jgi:hypothetical protein
MAVATDDELLRSGVLHQNPQDLEMPWVRVMDLPPLLRSAASGVPLLSNQDSGGQARLALVSVL